MDEKQMMEPQITETQMTEPQTAEMQTAPAQANEPAKPGVGKRIGYFFLSLSPAAASLLAQLGIGMVVMILYAVIGSMQYQAAHPGLSQAEFMQEYMRLVMEAAPLGVFMYHLISLPGFGLWYYFGCGKPKLKKSIHNLSVKAILIAILSGLVLCFLSNGIVGIECYVIPDQVEAYAQMAEAAGLGVTIWGNVAAVLLAPIGEELVCRGLSLYYAEKAFSRFWIANVLQAFLFACMHGNIIQGSYAFVLGLMLGYLTKRYHSLIPAMLLHFVVNFSSTVFMDRVMALIPESLLSYIILTALATAVTLLLILWSRRGGKKEA